MNPDQILLLDTVLKELHERNAIAKEQLELDRERNKNQDTANLIAYVGLIHDENPDYIAPRHLTDMIAERLRI